MSRKSRPTGMSDLPSRIGTALAYGGVMLAVLLWGRLTGWAILMALSSALVLAEFYRLTREGNRLPNEVFGVAAATAMPMAAAFEGTVGLSAVFTILVVASLLWHLAFRQVRLVDTAVTVFGAIYVGFTLSHLVLMRELNGGTIFVLATLAAVWLSDMLAYFVGSSLGRSRMAPRISPNKTWEGFAGSVLGAVIVWVLVYVTTDTGISLVWHVVIGVCVAIAGVVGDLVESRIKREVGVKDSGKSLPGHGGFLDRFDALLVVAVVAYYLLLWAGA